MNAEQTMLEARVELGRERAEQRVRVVKALEALDKERHKLHDLNDRIDQLEAEAKSRGYLR